MAADRPRLLVVSTNLSLLRGHYENVLVALAQAGVEVSIRYLKQKWLSVEEFEAVLVRRGVADRISVAPLPGTAHDPAELLSLRLRELGNVLRYLDPDYTGRTRLRARAFEAASPGVRRWGSRISRLPTAVALQVARSAGWLERCLPPSRSASALVAAEAPDAVVATPLVRAPEYVEYLKAAAAQGITTATWIESWDNLTNKGLLHFAPDRVFVWNRQQAEELARYHGVPVARACITGAQTFDHWFDGSQPAPREEFCARIGIPPGRPIILYLSSSRQIAPNEPDFFERWLAAVRASGTSELSEATVLLRPHPTMVEPWLERSFDSRPGVALSTGHDDTINSDDFRVHYRDELYHAVVAVGLNTSGLVDAAIFGKPVCTVELPELFHSQRGTVHFRHLVEGSPGLLRTTSTLEEHVETLAELVSRDPYALDARSEAFVREFIRPHGLDVAPAQVFFEEMLRLCSEQTPGRRTSGIQRFVGIALARAAVVAGAPLEERPVDRILARVLAGCCLAALRVRHRIRGRQSRER